MDGRRVVIPKRPVQLSADRSAALFHLGAGGKPAPRMTNYSQRRNFRRLRVKWVAGTVHTLSL